MKYLKEFERIKTERPINVGDIVTWIGRDRKDFLKSYTPAESRDAEYGDKCKITKLKTIKGEIIAKAINLENDNKPICKFLDANQNRMPYSEDGHWWDFDSHFKHELDYTTKKFNI